MSHAFDLEQDPNQMFKNFRFPTPPERNLGGNFAVASKPSSWHHKEDSVLSPLSTFPARPQTPPEIKFPADTSSFVGMLESHLVSVRDLKVKTGVPAVRFTIPSQQPSPTRPKLRASRSSLVLDDAEMEVLRQQRKSITWRPRFDPESTRRLCKEALAEL
jgi:hypothetical protein